MGTADPATSVPIPFSCRASLLHMPSLTASFCPANLRSINGEPVESYQFSARAAPTARGPSAHDTGAGSRALAPPFPDMSGHRTRLWQVIPGLALGGMERVVIQLARSLDRDRFDISVLCLRRPGSFADELSEIGVPLVQAGPVPDGPDYFAFRRLADLFRREGVSVIHTHNTEAMLSAGLGGILARVPTMVHTDHSRAFPDKLRYMVAENLISRAYYRVAGVSEHTTRSLARYEKISRQRLLTVPNGIDAERLDQAADPGQTRRELGLSGRGPIIGIGAKLRPEKRVIDLVEAVSYLLPEFPGLTLLIAGDGIEAGALRRAVAELEIEEAVRFLGLRRDMPDIMRALDLLVLPSTREGMPMIILEALAARVPVVATRVGGIPEVISDGENGSLVEPLQPRALANEIARLLRDPALRARYGREGRRIFEERYSAAAMARSYEAIYLRGLGTGRRHRVSARV